MRTWTGRHVVELWLAWTALVITAAGLVLWRLASRSDGFALSLPTRVFLNGQPVAPGLAVVLAGLVTLTVLYLPPILATLVWFMRRGRG
jgi:hypothetical protein